MNQKEFFMNNFHDLERRLFRAQCRVRCLDAQIERIDYTDFPALMVELEAAQDEMEAASRELLKARLGTFRSEG